ncbi:Uncharacterised protein [Legionella sainthelensi]|nr:Uncharacterised protein [Legionella sainthelensi]
MICLGRIPFTQAMLLAFQNKYPKYHQSMVLRFVELPN